MQMILYRSELTMSDHAIVWSSEKTLFNHDIARNGDPFPER